MRGTFPACCASTVEHGARSREHRARKKKILVIGVGPALFSDLRPLTAHGCHLITLSALAKTFGGIVRPICFAVLRFITSSNFMGRSTGRSAGLVPFKILST